VAKRLKERLPRAEGYRGFTSTFKSLVRGLKNGVHFNSLRQQALWMVGADVLMTNEQRLSTTAWIEQTAAHADTPEPDRRRLLALFIITERRP